jgi:acetylornithine/N-succinyldiaminopimelate aminotransferase
MAKAIGGGIPMGAFAVDEKLAHVFKPGDHGTTFGGNVLACAASYATLCTLDENHMADTAAKQGEYFKGKMKELQAKFPDKITDVRGSGLILGMELAKPGAFVVDKCLAKGFIINCTVGNVLRFVPPLIISKAEIDALVAALAEIFQEF